MVRRPLFAQAVARELTARTGWDGYAAAAATRHVGRHGHTSPWYPDVRDAVEAAVCEPLRRATPALAALARALRDAGVRSRDALAAAGPPEDRKNNEESR